jgi:hypothetical protein
MGLGNSQRYLQEASLFGAKGFTRPREINFGKSIDTKADLSAKVVLKLKASIMTKRLLQRETRVFFAFFWRGLLKMR